MIKHKKYNDIIYITGEIETTRNYIVVWKYDVNHVSLNFKFVFVKKYFFYVFRSF
jgi:hypothetical protein